MGVPSFQTERASIPDVPDADAVNLTGKVTYLEAPELRESLLGEIDPARASRLVLQLGGVERMDTSGAAVLAEALKVGQARGVRILLCSPSESVLGIFRLAGFEEVLGHCCADVEETHRRLTE